MTDDVNFEVCIGKTILDGEIIGEYKGIRPVFHYTSPEGLLGILGKDGVSLWFSQYDSLNDITEGTHIVDVYRKVCDKLYRQGKIKEIFYNEIREIKPSIQEAFLYSNEESNKDDGFVDRIKFDKNAQKFICCFSTNSDSLPMWNYYTKENQYEGYNIGFSFWRTQHLDIQNDYGKGYKLRLFSVIYEDKEQEKIIQSKIEKLYPFCQDYDNKNANILRIKNALAYFLRDLSLKFKKSCFRHEQEVRAILTIPSDQKKFEVQYRNKSGYIIPYIKVDFPKEAISNITVGPLINNEMAVKNIKALIQARNYSPYIIDIKSSQIPIRY